VFRQACDLTNASICFSRAKNSATAIVSSGFSWHIAWYSRFRLLGRGSCASWHGFAISGGCSSSRSLLASSIILSASTAIPPSP